MEQPHSCELSGGKNDLFSPSPLRGSGENVIFVPLNLGRILFFLAQRDRNVLFIRVSFVVGRLNFRRLCYFAILESSLWSHLLPGAAARYNRLARERERERHKILKSYIQQTTCKEHSLLLRLLLLFCCMTEVGRAGGRPRHSASFDREEKRAGGAPWSI